MNSEKYSCLEERKEIMINKSKQELIDTARRLQIGSEYASYYEFAKSFLTHAISDGKKETDSFFKLVRNIENQVSSNSNSIDSTTKAVLGKTGNIGRTRKNNNQKENSINCEQLKLWCYSIRKNNLNSGYSIDELNYIMGYAQRLSKIENLKAITRKNRNDNIVEKFNNNEEKRAKEKENNLPESTVYRCSKCKKKVDVGMIIRFKTKLNCPNCGKSNYFSPSDKA